MERLTEWRDGHGALTHGDGYTKLAQYEDSGLTPEEVKSLKLYAMEKAVAEITEFDGIPIDRLRELAQAEKDGRLVVLPCKVGDTVYLLVNGNIIETEVGSIHQWTSGDWKLNTHTDRRSPNWTGYEVSFDVADKTVFLSREEAEERMKEL